jgi:hypothetical protein
MTDDELIERIRVRAADPRLRVDDRPSAFMASAASLDVGGLAGMARSLASDLQALVRGGPTDALVARAEGLRQAMETPAERPLPPRATREELDDAERRMGTALPPLLRRLYAEIANGGFGPGPGIVGVAGGWTTEHGKSMEDLHAEMLDAVSEDSRWVWPRTLLPIADLGGVFACVDAAQSGARVVEFDFEELDQGGRDRGWSRAFREVAPSLAAWFERWLAEPSPQARTATVVADMRRQAREATLAHWRAMTPAQRAEYGLPEVGWERELFPDWDQWGADAPVEHT